MLVIDMLIRAAAASAEIWALWRDAIRRTLLNFDQICFGELLLFPDDFGGNQFALNGVRNKNGFALFPSDAFSAERDVLNFQINKPHFIINLLQLSLSANDRLLHRGALNTVLKHGLNENSTLLSTPQQKCHVALSARSMAASRLSSLMGLMRCSEKPACKLRSMSPLLPKPLIAIPGTLAIARNCIIRSIPVPSGRAISLMSRSNLLRTAASMAERTSCDTAAECPRRASNFCSAAQVS